MDISRIFRLKRDYESGRFDDPAYIRRTLADKAKRAKLLLAAGITDPDMDDGVRWGQEQLEAEHLDAL